MPASISAWCYRQWVRAAFVQQGQEIYGGNLHKLLLMLLSTMGGLMSFLLKYKANCTNNGGLFISPTELLYLHGANCSSHITCGNQSYCTFEIVN